MELLCQLAWVGVRARGRWSRLHQQLSARVVGRLVYASATDAAEHNPVREDEGKAVGAGVDALLDFLGAVIERASPSLQTSMISCRKPATEARNALRASTKAVLPSTVSALPRRRRTSSVMCAASMETSVASNATKTARRRSDGLTRFNAPAASV